MTLDPHIAFRNMDVSETLDQRIRARVAELERLFDRIVACNVAIEAHHRTTNGRLSFHVYIDLAVPGRTIAVRREPAVNHGHEDAFVAVREAFDMARRQLEDHVRVARGEVKTRAAAGWGA